MSKLKTRWDRVRHAFATVGPVVVDHSEKDKVNINKIIDRARRTGIWPSQERKPVYINAADAPTALLDSFAAVERAKEAFMALPAKLRRELGNDPRNLESWLSDPKNVEDAVEYGLIQGVDEPLKSPESDSKKRGEADPSVDGSKRSGAPSKKTRGSESADEGTGT